MKINELSGISVEQLQSGRTGGVTPQEGKTSPEQPAGGVDVIHLSPQAKLMHKAAQVVAETPDVRQEKVMALKDSVEQGTYEVDAQKVAEKLILETLIEKP
ncbi:MAG: flagellar biosynthesis anti-sigma factor FlgM [Deltaproteobacteria bacterium]|nr:flagellar biosynthesis anti-sigma factor FlgM [Deltaproteobacteria bacterium]